MSNSSSEVSSGRQLKLAKTHDYCVSGKPKLTVILIHGIASSSATFEGALSYLEGTKSLSDVRFVTYDLLGAGKSMKSDELKYDFTEQLEALDNSVRELEINTPVVMVGHSMGTMIVSRFTDNHKSLVNKVVLISAPVYREEDVKNPMFEKALDGFKVAVSQKNKSVLDDKTFNNELKYIVSNPNNYSFLARLSKPTYIIYGELDRIIAAFNIPGLLRTNKNIRAIRTPSAHSVSRDKYTKMVKILEDSLNETA